MITYGQWKRIVENPTLHPDALRMDEAFDPKFPWHSHAHLPNSSQVFCISAFGTLRQIGNRNQIVNDFLLELWPDANGYDRWDIRLESQDASLLNEVGAQPTSVDAVLTSPGEVICIESKFDSDARQGLGTCSQTRGNPAPCAGHYGPDSDLRTGTPAWCRLELWEKARSPRLYWMLGRQFFQPGVFDPQQPGEECPLRNNYQLMRNFLFAAMLAREERKSFFRVVVISPHNTSETLLQQVQDFQAILLPEYQDRIQFAPYETYLNVLHHNGNDAVELAEFLALRIQEAGIELGDLGHGQ